MIFSTNRFFSSHTVPQRLNPFTAQNSEYHHERMEEIIEIPAWNRVGLKHLSCIIFSEQLHSDDSKNVDNDNQNKRKIS